MCGIFYYSGKTKLKKSTIAELRASLQSRGRERIESEDCANDRYNYALHQRLPTDGVNSHVDIKHNGKIFLYNGIVTNIDELCRVHPNLECHADTDTNLLREGYAAYEIPFLSEVCGMFAFAFDFGDTVHIVRDSVGIKPMYYVHDQKKYLFACASEIKTLVAFRTQIYTLMPGTVGIYDKRSGLLQLVPFTYIPSKYSTADELYTVLKHVICEPTIRYLMQTDKKIGVLLSGGIDSTLILCILLQELPTNLQNRLRFYTLATPDSSDALVVKQLIERYGIHENHRFVCVPNSPSIIENITHHIYEVESGDPRVVKVFTLQVALSKAIADDDIEVVLSGEGSDELFGGYERFFAISSVETMRGHHLFFEHVFPYTLLQRLDRAFARKCIEARVPFLDQRVIACANTIAPELKVHIDSDNVKDKCILRVLGRSIGIPSYVCDRNKTTMTKGVTNKANRTTSDGFLEAECIQLRKEKLESVSRNTFQELFPYAPHVFVSESGISKSLPFKT